MAKYKILHIPTSSFICQIDLMEGFFYVKNEIKDLLYEHFDKAKFTDVVCFSHKEAEKILEEYLLSTIDTVKDPYYDIPKSNIELYTNKINFEIIEV